jgi:hypothetical protein
MELLNGVGHVEPHFGLFGDMGSVGARYVHGLAKCTIGSEILLDTLNGPPR